MFSLEPSETQVLARLARMSLEPGEEKRFGEQLDKILRYVETLQNVNTDGVEEYVAGASETAKLREDQPDLSTNSEEMIREILMSVPHKQDELVVVPKIKSDEG